MARNFVKKNWYKLGGIWKNEFENEDGSKATVLGLTLNLEEPAVLKVRKGNKVVDVNLVPDSKGRVFLSLQNPVDEIKGLLNSGYIDEAEAEKRKAALPVELRYNVNIGIAK